MKLINISIVIIVTLGTAILIGYQNFSMFDDVSLFDNETNSSQPILKMVLLPFVMVLGIISGELHTLFDKRKSNTISKKVFLDVFSEKSLWKSLLASPLIFGVVYSLSKDQPDILIALLFAFENGFFCNLLLSKKKKKVDNTSPNNV